MNKKRAKMEKRGRRERTKLENCLAAKFGNLRGKALCKYFKRILHASVSQFKAGYGKLFQVQLPAV